MIVEKYMLSRKYELKPYYCRLCGMKKPRRVLLCLRSTSVTEVMRMMPCLPRDMTLGVTCIDPNSLFDFVIFLLVYMYYWFLIIILTDMDII